MISSGCFYLTEVAFHVAIESIVVILERLWYENTCLVKIFCQTLFIISLSICVNYYLLIVTEQLIYSNELYHKKHANHQFNHCEKYTYDCRRRKKIETK